MGKSVVLVDNSDTQNTAKTGTWTKGDIAGEQGYNHETHTAGTGTDAFTWTLNIPKDGTYAAYVKFPKVTGAATTAKYTLTHATGTVDKTIDQNAAANQGTWVSLGSYSFKQGNDAKRVRRRQPRQLCRTGRAHARARRRRRRRGHPLG
ncbi:golvesin C-terminal-like domain-containing protein [Streptomyces mirabilis]|uniref:golvesin C-terminal-like domain-containing protein n=1 Tax=Streptomyces mirabilis TaxID=68239 RepID=UPI0015A5E480|nr:hypothetical protein [Streptomyces mirabilis]